MDRLCELGCMAEVKVMTADGLVCDEPCFLLSMVITAGAGGAATALIYNGFGTGGDLMYPLSTITSYSKDIVLPIPVAFSSALYADIGNNVTGLVVHFIRHRMLHHDIRTQCDNTCEQTEYKPPR